MIHAISLLPLLYGIIIVYYFTISSIWYIIKLQYAYARIIALALIHKPRE